MYGEWLDAIPILIDGCYENNISQLQDAERYNIRHEMLDRAAECRQMIAKEKLSMKIENKDHNTIERLKQFMFGKYGG